MKAEFRRFRTDIGLSLLLANLTIALVGTGMIFALEGILDIGGVNGVVIAAAAGIAIAVALAFFEERMISRPFNVVVQALLHVSKGDNSSDTSDFAGQWAKTGLVHEMVKSIFELASMSHEMTTDIEQQRSFFSDSLDAMPMLVYMYDSDNYLKYANAAGREIIDFDYEAALGQPMGKLLDINFQTDETMEQWLDQCRQNKIHEDKFWERVSLIRTDNTKKIYDVVAHYSKSDKNDVELMLIMIDRTSEYTADESEMDFVALAAHELRSPITVIRGYLDVFEDEMKETFNVEQLALLQKMTVSAEMLSGYVNNILNVARVDQGHIQLHIRQANWTDIIKDAYEDLALRATVHGRVLKLEIPEKLPTVAVDRVSITEVINNLVDNAIKYSFEGGEVLIKVNEHDGQISTSITDQGVGIPNMVVGNLFKKFYRSHRTKTGVTGTGLGLYLCKAIVDSHGGNIWVRSQEGKGSTFGFEIPTYDSIADTLKSGNNDGEGIKRSSHGWIKNHSLNRR